MSLLAPAWLLIGLVAGIIFLIHRRRRPQFLTVPSLLLWRHVASAQLSQASRRAFNWQMLMQIAVVLLLAFALAQPILGDQVTGPEHWVFVLDASGSMQATDVGPSRFEAARGQLLEQLSRAWERPLPPRISVIAAAPHPYVVAGRYVEREDVEARLGALRPSDGAADWTAVAALLAGLVVDGEPTRVFLLTDGGGPGDAVGALAEAVPTGSVQVFLFNGSGSNRALSGLWAEPVPERENTWRIRGEVQQFGGSPERVQVRFFYLPRIGAEPVPWTARELDLAPGKPATFDIELALPGSGVLEARLPDDHLGWDNRAYVVLFQEAPVRVLVVGSPNPLLERALRAVPGVEVAWAEALPALSGPYDLVIVNDTPVATRPNTHTWWIGRSPYAESAAGIDLNDPAPTGWQTSHPLARWVDWTTLSVSRTLAVPRLPGAQVLVEAAGIPLVQARTTPLGREVVTAFSLDDSNWMDQAAFPVFVANLIDWIRGPAGAGRGQNGEVGRPVPLDPALLREGLRVVAPDGTDVPLPWGNGPAGAAGPDGHGWMPAALEPIFYPQRAGLYRLEVGGQIYPLAVNGFNAAESDLQAVEIPNGSGETTSRPRWVAAWPWLVGAALALAVLEGWLSGRRWERFLYRSALTARGPWARARRYAVGLQVLAILCLLGALLDLPWYERVRQTAIVVVVDEPPGMSAERRADVQRLVERLNAEVDGSRVVGVVRGGAVPRVARDLGAEAVALPPPGTPAALSASNLEYGLSLGLGLLPPGVPGRIVLVADGVETRGQLARVVPELAVRRLPVDVLPIGNLPAGEVLVETASAPPAAFAGAPFRIQAVVFSQRPTTATIRVERNGELWTEQAAPLGSGRNRVETVVIEEEPGTYVYEFAVDAAGDSLSFNNRYAVVASVLPPPRVAIVSPDPAPAQVLQQALRMYAIEADVMAPNRAPWNLVGWAHYDVVVLMNVPAIDLHSAQQRLLETWVRDLGGGLVVLGGEKTFGPGGYYQTVFERLLPLSSRVPRESPSVAMVFVLDKSGSMQQREAGVSRLEITKQATIGALDLLHPENRVGVVVFDSDAQVLVPLQPVTERETLHRSLDRLTPGGGTSIYPALVLALEQLRQADTMVRHIVLMTDGLSQPGDFEGILARIRDAGITVSTVAVGRGADVARLERIARLGDGTFHVTEDWQLLPSILAQEALLQSDAPIEEGTFVPRWSDGDSPFAHGLPEPLPPLHGFTLTTAKDGARVHLVGPSDEPILASWRYGLGKVVAFTSHGAGPWAADWVNMPEYPLFWSQVVRWVASPASRAGLHVAAERNRDDMVLIVEAVGSGGEAESGLVLAAELRNGEEGQAVILTLDEATPGTYRARFTPGQPGVYQVTLRPAVNGQAAAEGTPASSAAAAVYVPYPRRYGLMEDGGDVLVALARLSGGRVLAEDAALFVNDPQSRWLKRSGWRAWALLGLAAFVAGLLVRYSPLRWWTVPERAGGRRPGKPGGLPVS